MHSLLDNPFGSHCAKFPLRAQVTEIINTTRTMLTHADIMPAAFRDVFQLKTHFADSRVTTPQRNSVRGFTEFGNQKFHV